jgi:F0F1-type ATP synthase membrane subunit c/vacuolar-type H+-ATPase subunit K
MQQASKKNIGDWGFFLPIGIGLGVGLGALLGNIGVGMAFGVALGTTLSLIAYYQEQDS